MESVGVKSYGIGITTLEEVFLKLGSREDELDPEDKPVLKKGMKLLKYSELSSSQTMEDQKEDHIEFEKNSCTLFWMSVKSLVSKRFLISLRNLKSFIIEILIPIILITAGLLLTTMDFV
jgi:hypothetical protein